MNKQRFKQLYQLAHGGDMCAKADLWLEFEFAYDHDPLPSFILEGEAPSEPPIVVAGGGDPGASPNINLRSSASICGSNISPALPVSPAASRPCKHDAVADQPESEAIDNLRMQIAPGGSGSIKNRKSEIKNTDLPKGGRL